MQFSFLCFYSSVVGFVLCSFCILTVFAEKEIFYLCKTPENYSTKSSASMWEAYKASASSVIVVWRISGSALLSSPDLTAPVEGKALGASFLELSLQTLPLLFSPQASKMTRTWSSSWKAAICSKWSRAPGGRSGSISSRRTARPYGRSQRRCWDPQSPRSVSKVCFVTAAWGEPGPLCGVEGRFGAMRAGPSFLLWHTKWGICRVRNGHIAQAAASDGCGVGCAGLSSPACLVSSPNCSGHSGARALMLGVRHAVSICGVVCACRSFPACSPRKNWHLSLTRELQRCGNPRADRRCLWERNPILILISETQDLPC